MKLANFNMFYRYSHILNFVIILEKWIAIDLHINVMDFKLKKYK